MTDKTDITSLFPKELEAFIASLGEGKFRAKQISEWIVRGAQFHEMTNLSKALREKLSERCMVVPIRIRESIQSKI
ncbi:MAG: 23S rRNA (adenine(2503)-C(2))-methyltransferase RlmN, partial [Clostridia bacterium]|nr:23S rRNA (adenine(2503)-C(2))-methyltransferase RlmN [Clostridia bacterium]